MAHPMLPSAKSLLNMAVSERTASSRLPNVNNRDPSCVSNSLAAAAKAVIFGAFVPGTNSFNAEARATIALGENSSKCDQDSEWGTPRGIMEVPHAFLPVSVSHLLPSVRQVLLPKAGKDGHQQEHVTSRPPVMHTTKGNNFGSSAFHGKPKRKIAKPGSKLGGHPCQICGRLFTRKSDASKHVRVVHERLKTFQCVLCDRRFARKDYLTKHEKSIHGVGAPQEPKRGVRKVHVE